MHRFPSAELADAWSKLQDCCGDDPEVESDGPCLSKRIVLATIGLWTVQERLAWSVHCTTQDADCPGPVTKTRYMPDGSQYKMCCTVLHSDTTMLPIGLLSLFDELRRVYRARQIVAQVPAVVTLGVHVDGLFYVAPPEAHAQLQQLALLEQYEHDEHCKVYKFKKCRWQSVPSCAQGASDSKPAFKPRLRTHWDFEDCERDIEQRTLSRGLCEEQLNQKARWNELIEGKTPPLSDAAFVMLANAIHHEGMLCVGPAGCGKSVLLKQFKAVFEGLQCKVRVNWP